MVPREPPPDQNPGSAYLFAPPFGLRSASLALPTAWPTLPSADFCVPIGSPRGSLSPQQQDRTQTSRGKSDRLHRTPAGSTALAFDGSGLRDQLSARPTKDASYPVSVRQVAVLFHASSRPRLAATPLRFPSASLPSSCAEDFHLQASRHARRTTCQPSLDAHFNTNMGATLYHHYQRVFTIAGIGVHDARKRCSRWIGISVQDGPEYAQTTRIRIYAGESHGRIRRHRRRVPGLQAAPVSGIH